MNTFQFNECGMCENPELVEVYRSGKDYVVIDLAQAPDGTWCEGVDYASFNRGGGHAAGFNQYRKKYATRRDALVAALKAEINHTDQYAKREGEEGQRNKKMLVAIRAYLLSLDQITTLFDLFA